jgi:hypothetical protein
MKTLLRFQAPSTLQAVFTVALASAVANPGCLPSYSAPEQVDGDGRSVEGGTAGLTISSVEPKVGAAGLSVSATRVTVKGTGFDKNVQVIFSNDRVCSSIQLVSPTEITCSAPLNEIAGPVPVTVERGGEKKALSYPFRYFYPDATFSGPRWKGIGATRPTLALAQDMNQDGFPDVVVAKENNNEFAVALLDPPQTRNGMIGTKVYQAYVGFSERFAHDLATANLFSSGKYLPSVVYAFNQEVKVYTPNAPGQPLGFVAPVDFQLSKTCPATGCRVAAVGLPALAASSGDGLVVSESGQLTLYWMKGNTPAPASRDVQSRKIADLTIASPPFLALSITTADFTGDGKVDLAVSGTNEKVLLYQGIDADPFFQFADSYPAKPNTVASLSADLDLDGRIDLVGLSWDQGNSLLPYFGGAMNLQPSALVTQLSAMPARGFAAGDWNGDGYPDIAFVDNSSGTAGKYGLAAGSGVRAAGVPVFGKATLPALPSFHPSIAMADFNNDGLADLLIPDYDNASVSIYVNTSGPPPRK